MTAAQLALWTQGDDDHVLLVPCRACKGKTCEKSFARAACVGCATRKSKCDMVAELTAFWELEGILLAGFLDGMLPSGELPFYFPPTYCRFNVCIAPNTMAELADLRDAYLQILMAKEVGKPAKASKIILRI